ncbi:hypothetical protein N7523_005369 [Penicillium sp. IBT 18751x]|nr:hypothetical protein N7523_005369 [Penicillium sp. IBT 18751x]
MAQPQTPDRSALGESWVIASPTTSNTSKEKDPKDHDLESPTPLPKEKRHKDHGRSSTTDSTESLSSSSWTLTGPELIMPSICEMPISEASWVAPVHPNDQSGIRKRRKVLPKSTTQEKQQDPDSSPTAKSESKASEHKSPSSKSKLARMCMTLLRMTINSLLIAGILHLLVLPELIQQFQPFFCDYPIIKSTYRDSCKPLVPRPVSSSTPMTTPENTLITAQNNLESIFTATLSTLTPLTHVLQESTNMLSDLHQTLQSSHPDVRNALNLEFTGSDAALRAATWEFDSLRADLRSAIDSLLSSPPQEAGPPSIARDTRLAAQFHRRAQYLDRLRSQLKTKADSLVMRFSTLDDHLEAVDGIVARERRAALAGGKRHGNENGNENGGIQYMLNSLSSYAFGARSSSGQTENAEGDAPQPTLALLRLAATHHRPVADEVSRLAKQLGEQRARSGSIW